MIHTVTMSNEDIGSFEVGAEEFWNFEFVKFSATLVRYYDVHFFSIF